jgi:hypothetical protein
MAMRLKKGDLIQLISTGATYRVRGPVDSGGAVTLYGRGNGGSYPASNFRRAKVKAAKKKGKGGCK